MRDEAFIRGKVPMTKMEVRATSLAYLSLYDAKHFLDIGAGTGSVCIEALCRQPSLQATAVERNEAGIELIKANAEQFGVAQRIDIIEAYAPCNLSKTVAFDRVFIGGTGGQLAAILEWLKTGYLAPKGIIVVNAIAIESLGEAIACLETAGFIEIEGTMIQASRLDLLGKYHYFKPLNPCYVIKATWAQALV